MKLKHAITLGVLPALLGPLLLGGTARAASCEPLAELDLGHTEIALAATVAAGGFRVPGRVDAPGTASLADALERLPEFCRVTATARPTPDSAIGIEVWLPASGWNGRLQSVGNGAWAGSVNYGALAGALAAGYAAASTDTGHTGNSASFAVGHPEKLVDFAHRAVHEMTVAAKAIVAAHYETAPEYSYFVGCSTGGRQALAEAQRYPGDYDGIVAGAAAYHPTHLQGTQIWTALVGRGPSGGALTPEQLPLIHSAVMQACDTLDGVADGVLENPQRCEFDPGELACAAGVTGSCLSPQQVETVRKIYAGPAGADGTPLFPGVARGSEPTWQDRLTGEPISLAVETYRDLVFADPQWDFRTFDPQRDIPKGVAAIGALMNSTDPNLAPFLARGGKLILYHGWNDFGIPPLSTVEYYERVLDTVERRAVENGVRLFMVPGMNHCRGGVGTDRFDAAAALDRWVTTDMAPARLDASREEGGRVVRTRPLCPYPQVAIYQGVGSTADAANFECGIL